MTQSTDLGTSHTPYLERRRPFLCSRSGLNVYSPPVRADCGVQRDLLILALFGQSVFILDRYLLEDEVCLLMLEDTDSLLFEMLSNSFARVVTLEESIEKCLDLPGHIEMSPGSKAIAERVWQRRISDLVVMRKLVQLPREGLPHGFTSYNEYQDDPRVVEFRKYPPRTARSLLGLVAARGGPRSNARLRRAAIATQIKTLSDSRELHSPGTKPRGTSRLELAGLTSRSADLLDNAFVEHPLWSTTVLTLNKSFATSHLGCLGSLVMLEESDPRVARKLQFARDIANAIAEQTLTKKQFQKRLGNYLDAVRGDTELSRFIAQRPHAGGSTTITFRDIVPALLAAAD